MKKLTLLLIMMLLLAACGGSETTVSPTDAPVAEDTAVATDTPVDTPTEEATTDVVDDAEETDVPAADGLDISYFFDGALEEEATIVDCTLSDGTETTCYEITIAGYPANYDVGPFCPPTIESTAEEGGIWLDGNAVYDIDGEFILGLADLYNDDNWKLYDDEGNVNITDTAEEFELAARPDVDPSLQNHCVEGRIEWLDNGEPVPTTVTIPTTPVVGDSATAGGNWGVTLNGVIIAAQAPVDAILSAYTIAAFDDCGGHINPVDGYHLHGAVGCSEVGEASEGETPIFAYAMDGYPIHSPLEAEAEAAANLDKCNGHTTEAFGYHYHANPAEENGVLTCFTGVTVQGQGGPGGGGPGGGNGGAPQGGRPGGPPDFAAAAEMLGITEQELMDALGPPPPDFAAAAETLGISVEELQDALGGGAEGGPPPADGSEEEAMDDSASGEGRLFALPGENIFPEGVSYDAASGKFYVGATSDGTLYVGDVNSSDEMSVFSEGGADGRVAAIGTKVDGDGNLWVAGGGTGQVFVYDTDDASLVATFTTPEADATFINDLAVTESGVYFTDSFRPILWRASGVAGGQAEAWLDFTGTAITYVDGFNLNGIAATADGSDLIVVHSGEGALYHINIETQAVTRIDTADTELTAGDGLALVGSTLYVTRNSFGEIVPLELSADFSTATGGTPITSDLFGYPTTIAYTGDSFLVANSQFNNRGGTPNLPFTVAQIPLPQDEEAAATTTFQLEAWADNWFAAYLGEELIVEDSVSITTERSFNAETATFEASYPLHLNFILKDFKENDTGLEYIGARNQQMGDGGFIMQLTDTSTGDVVAVTDSSFACLVIHEAPLDKSCENESNPVAGTAPCEFTETSEPAGWMLADYDDSAWTATTVHTTGAVDPKQGYDNISWDSSAEFIWGPDLETNNTLLCRVTVSGE